MRYQYGDDLKWSDPKFDDAAWPEAKDGKIPSPAFNGDGYLWVRYRIPVAADYRGPLAVTPLKYANAAIPPYEIWVNGQNVGGHGKLPPRPLVMARPGTLVFDLPNGLVEPGSTAMVARRIWVPPGWRLSPWEIKKYFLAEIGPRDFLQLRER